MRREIWLTTKKYPTAEKLLARWLELPNEPLLIHFAPGRFLVPSPGLPVSPAWIIRGAGIDVTFIQLDRVPGQGASVTVFYSDLAPGAQISDLTIDCNYHNQDQPRLINAISLTGSNARISRVKAIHWGTNGPENFIIDLSNSGGDEKVNCVIEECIVTLPAPVGFGGGVTALAIFTSVAPDTGVIHGGILRNNFVYGVKAGLDEKGSPKYFNAYSDCPGGMVLNNFAWDLTGPTAYGIYRDTWDGRDVVIQGNVFDNVARCIFINGTNLRMEGYIITHNVFRMGEGGWGINYYTGPASNENKNAQVLALVITGNVIYPAKGVVNATALALNTRITATVFGNVLQGAGTGKDCFVAPDNDPYLSTERPPALQIKSWGGNVNLAGDTVANPG